MSAYLTLARKAFRRTLTYRAAFWTELAINLLFMVLYVYLWRALLGDADGAAGYDRAAIMSYVVVAQTVMTIQFTVRATWEIERKVRSGAIVMELLRPIDFQAATIATACGPGLHTFLFNMLPKLALFGLAGVLSAPPSAPAAVLFVVAALLGFLVQVGLEILVGLSAFWLVEIRGLHMFIAWGFGALFSGFFAPLEIYPDWLAAIGRVLPFQAVVYTPSAIWSGRLAGGDALAAVAVQLAWAFILVAAGRSMLALARRRLVSQGG